MLKQEITTKVLTVGADWRHPRGGVACVMECYAKYIWGTDNFKSIVNSGEGPKIKKMFIAISSTIRFVWKLLKDRDIKIVHIHTASYNSFKRSVVFGKIAKFFNKKMIYHIHGGGFKEFCALNPEWTCSQLSKADYIITLSPLWLKYFNSVLSEKQTKVSYINNIIPAPITDLEKKDNDGKVHILFLGKICKEKGIYDLLDTIYERKDFFSGKIELHIGGNGETKNIISLINEKGLDDIITFHGWVSGALKNELFNKCDYYILPSYTEGMPISILEAFSYGLPVITTPIGGIPEVVNTENGFLFTPGDRIELSRILVNICNKVDYKLMSEKAKDSICHNLPEAVSSRLDRIYSELSD